MEAQLLVLLGNYDRPANRDGRTERVIGEVKLSMTIMIIRFLPENMFVGSMSGIRQFLNLQQGTVATLE